MPIYHNNEMMLASNKKEDRDFAKSYRLQVMNNKINQSQEEYLLYQIISSAELILDELNNGVDLNDRNYDQIRLADSILLDIEQELTANNKPSNLK
jgi:hypothetical protein